MVNQLVTRWNIAFSNGPTLVCYRKRKPTRLAAAWAKERRADGSVYGTYTITAHGLFTLGMKTTKSLKQAFDVTQMYASVADLRIHHPLRVPRLLGHYQATTVMEAIRLAAREHQVPAALLRAELVTLPV